MNATLFAQITYYTTEPSSIYHSLPLSRISRNVKEYRRTLLDSIKKR